MSLCLKPKLAGEFVEAIAADLKAVGVSVPLSRQAAWKELILERFVHHSLQFDDIVSSYDEDVVAEYRAKYPQLEPLIEDAMECARQVLPEDHIVEFHVHSDPEGCHTCWEGQHLCMEFCYKGPRREDGDIDWEVFRALDRKFDDLYQREGGPWDKMQQKSMANGFQEDYESLLSVDVKPWLPDDAE